MAFPFSNKMGPNLTISTSITPTNLRLASYSSSNNNPKYINSWRYSHIFDPYLMNHFNIFNHWIMHQFLVLSIYLYRYWDKGLIEFIGPTGLVRLTNRLGFDIDSISTGFIPHYAFLFISLFMLCIITPLTFLPFILLFVYLFYIFFFL
jgi:hypothetical protein